MLVLCREVGGRKRRRKKPSTSHGDDLRALEEVRVAGQNIIVKTKGRYLSRPLTTCMDSAGRGLS